MMHAGAGNGYRVLYFLLVSALNPRDHVILRPQPLSFVAARPLDYAQLYRVLAESAPDAIVTIDSASVLLSINHAGEQMFGYPAADVLGQSLTMLMPERMRARHAHGMGRYLSTGVRNIPWSRVRVPILTKDGREIMSEISFGEFVSEGARIFSGVIRDISNTIETERVLAETASQLQDQATELEQQIEEAQALTEELEETNQLLIAANTDLAEATAIAQANAQRVQDVLASLSDAVSVFDEEWRWIYVNPAASDVLRNLGKDPVSAIGAVLWDVLPELIGTRFETESKQAVLTGEITQYEEYLASLDCWFEIRMVPAANTITSFSRDVTIRRRAEDVLRHQEEEFRTLANTIPTLAWMAQPDGWIYWYNERWYEYTGTTPANMEGWGWQRVHDPEVLPDVLREWTQSIATGQPFDMVFPLRSASGEFRRFLTRVAPLRDRAGTIVRWFGMNTDVEAEHAARDAVETVVEAVADGFVAFDAQFRYTYVNQRAAEMWGKPAESFLGKTPVEVWAELDMERSPFVLLFRRLLETRKTETLEAYAPTLGRWIETRGYPSSDGGIVVFFQDVSERRRAQDASMLLAEASHLLASSSDYEETLANVARAMVPRLGDWAAVDLLDDPGSAAWPPSIQRVAIVHGDPAKLALAAALTTKYPERWTDDNGMAKVIGKALPLFIPVIPDEMLVAGAQDQEHLAMLRAIGFCSIIVVPITARDRVLGALTLCTTESARRYTEADLALAEDLGRRAGITIDTVRLLRDAQEARAAAELAAKRTGRLQHVTALLAGALTERQVADAVVQEGLPALGASDGAVYVVSHDERQLEHVTNAGMLIAQTHEFKAFAIDTSLPLADAVRTGELVALQSRAEVAARYPLLEQTNQTSLNASLLAVPLRAGDTALGGMVLGFHEERVFTEEDRAFAETLGRLCAQAMLRARLYEDAQRARATAEEANAAKMAFLATMSHELRTPLNAIGGHVQIMDMGLYGPVTPAQREALQRVNRAQAHLLGLINDVLTYAKVESGRLEYAITSVDAVNVIRDVGLLVEPQFLANELRLELNIGDATDAVSVLADREKLSQILLNLLSNALKFTQGPGTVSVTFAHHPSEPLLMEIAVRDTGAGIPTEKLEAIFEPFVQLGRDLASTHEGTGLGLSISRDLARGMGGDLTVASVAGKGSTFILSLRRA